MSKPLSSAERRDLKARAHALHPVVMIGNDGLTPAVLKAIDEALRSHELIKIRAAGDDRDARDALLAEIAAQTGASPVQHIGKVLVVWRERPPEAAEPPAKRPRAKTARPAAVSARPARGASARGGATAPGRGFKAAPARGGKAAPARTTAAARPARSGSGPRGADGVPAAPARPGRSPRLLPGRGRPTRSGRR
jgi:RNA-binding protein